MDMDSWATLARLAREAKAELEATEPGAKADINACEDVVARAEGAVMDGMWTGDPEVLAEWLDRAKRVAVAVHNARKPEEHMHLPLDSADDPNKIIKEWLAAGPKGRTGPSRSPWSRTGEAASAIRSTPARAKVASSRSRCPSPLGGPCEVN